MQMKPGPLRQSLLHLAGFMGAIVINDQMGIQVVRHSPVNLLEEGEKLLVTVATLALGQHFARGYIQGSKQRCGAVMNVVRGHTFHTAQLQRQRWLGFLQSLDLHLLV